MYKYALSGSQDIYKTITAQNSTISMILNNRIIRIKVQIVQFLLRSKD